VRYLIALIALFTLAAACGSGDASSPSPSAPASATANATRTPFPTVAPPEVLAAVPEGRLVITGPDSFVISGGEATRLPNAEVFPSPDGAGAVFVRKAGNNTWDAIGVITGGEARIIEEWEPSWYPAVAWDRDGSRFAYSVEPLSYATDDPIDIWVVGADGGKRKKYASSAYPRPAGWAADGRLLAWVDDGYKLIAADGTTEAVPLTPEENTFGMTLSPDGTRIASQAGWVEEKPNSQTLHYTGLWVYDIAARVWTKVADLGLSVSRPTAFVSADVLAALARKGAPPLSWAPDSTSIVYSNFIEPEDETEPWSSELWIVYLNGELPGGGYQSVMLADGGFGPEWSADSKYVSFVDGERQAGYHRPHGEIHTLSFTTDAVNTGQAKTTAWASNGNLVSCQTNGIRIWDPETGQITEVLDADGEQVHGAYITGDSAWSPSGRYVAFDAPQGALGGAAVYILDTEAAELTTLISSGGYFAAAWLE